MFENLDVFKISSAMAKHAGARQALIAQNVANADTPRYLARDLPAFDTTYEAGGGMMQKTTRAKHIHGSGFTGNGVISADNSVNSPDGNSVSLETEMLKATDALRQHDRALAIYKSALGILRSSLGRR
jgi:flagellar basal-body rod protein FlgB